MPGIRFITGCVRLPAWAGVCLCLALVGGAVVRFVVKEEGHTFTKGYAGQPLWSQQQGDELSHFEVDRRDTEVSDVGDMLAVDRCWLASISTRQAPQQPIIEPNQVVLPVLADGVSHSTR